MSKSVIKSDRVKLVRDASPKDARGVDEAERNRRQGGTGGTKTTPAVPDPAVLKRQQDQLLRKAEKEAYIRGRAEGLREGRAEQEKKLRHILDTMGILMEALKKSKEAVVKNSERAIVDLSLALASRIIRQEVMKDRSIIVRILGDVLKDLDVMDGVKVMLSPVDHLFIRENEADILKEIKNIGNIRFEADPKMEAGGVVVDTGFSIVDARIGEQLSAVGQAFREECISPQRER